MGWPEPRTAVCGRTPGHAAMAEIPPKTTLVAAKSRGSDAEPSSRSVAAVEGRCYSSPVTRGRAVLHRVPAAEYFGWPRTSASDLKEFHLSPLAYDERKVLGQATKKQSPRSQARGEPAPLARVGPGPSLGLGALRNGLFFALGADRLRIRASAGWRRSPHNEWMSIAGSSSLRP